MRVSGRGMGVLGALAVAASVLAGCGGVSDEGPPYCVDGNDPDTGAPLRLCTYKPSESCVEALDPRLRRHSGPDPFRWICPPG